MQPAIRPILAIALLVAFSTAWANTATEVFEHAAQSIVVVQANNAKGKTVGMGSGVVIGKEEIVTNCHVIEDAADYAVKHDKRQFTAQLKHADWTRDVCSLTVKGLNASAVPLGSTKRLKVGQKVFAIGAPQGLELTLSEGILSSLRELDGGRYLQISAPISPGSSGGGLFDDTGKLIGLPTFYLSEGQQLNFAVPVEWVQALPQRAVLEKPRGPTSVEWGSKAIAMEKKQDWLGLLQHAREWTQVQPGEALAWFSLGVSYTKSGDHISAISAYQHGLRISPENAVALYNLGLSYYLLGKTEEAIEVLTEAVRLDTENSAAWNNLGLAYVKYNQPQKGINAYQKALSIEPSDDSTWSNLGMAYIVLLDPANALEATARATQINPSNPEAWLGLGMAYILNNQPEKVNDAYRKLQSLDIDMANTLLEVYKEQETKAKLKFGLSCRLYSYDDNRYKMDLSVVVDVAALTVNNLPAQIDKNHIVFSLPGKSNFTHRIDRNTGSIIVSSKNYPGGIYYGDCEKTGEKKF